MNFLYLRQIFLRNNLQYINDQFVVTPIDKAHANIAFIYKCFCMEVLIKHLGIGKDGMLRNSDT